MNIIGVIPARYASTRLPGKPLADICGKPMIRWVYDRVKKAEKINHIIVATDDEKIVNCCNEHSIPTVLTGQHNTAANRIWEVSQTVKGDFYLQINGDEPLIQPEILDLAVPDEIPQEIEYGTNIITKMQNPVEVMDNSNIKVVFDCNKKALYLSRFPIPYPYKTLDFDYFKHVGIIGYNKKMLNFYKDSVPGIFEKIEGIDTLRFIDYRKTLQFIEANDVKTLSVDTQKDLDRVRKIISEGQTWT